MFKRGYCLALSCLLLLPRSGASSDAQQGRVQDVPFTQAPSEPRLTATYHAAILDEAEFPAGATRAAQGERRADLAAQERCAEAPVDVTAASSDERRLACSAAGDALRLLGRCEISLRRPLQVEILSEVRHPFFKSVIFGLFDMKEERVLITRPENLPSLVKGTPYEALPPADFYNSLIVHEVIHGVMHQNLQRPATTHAAYEYPAYALQIESLPFAVREKFLRSFDQTAMTSEFLFNDAVLLFDPYFFAARAHQHFKATPDGCTHLHALLRGEVPFILALPPRF